MNYIKTDIGEIDIEEMENTLNSEGVNIEEVLEIWTKHEAVYDFWAKTYGLEIINKWFDEHTTGAYEEYIIEAMIYGIQEFVKWIKTLN